MSVVLFLCSSNLMLRNRLRVVVKVRVRVWVRIRRDTCLLTASNKFRNVFTPHTNLYALNL